MLEYKYELNDVRLGDLYRDQDGDVWEVYALCDQPTASVRRLYTEGAYQLAAHSPYVNPDNETHVIGCLNWQNKWKAGPFR